jgi:hypothetical protein
MPIKIEEPLDLDHDTVLYVNVTCDVLFISSEILSLLLSVEHI